ncbi:diacylglycerol O-acyltransferase 3-like [Lolium rigidum]|uniref:diacylglycerol O-acyltransferase 3-like n=1 Tax=Lolium rigidum TaxID=89674 RepID=UPI001F5D97BA|nr:diacylglycerol O-acyltransferase 3-like [Lolium rigidum]
MELTGAAALRRTLASASMAAVPGQRRRQAPSRVACVGRGCGAFADEAHLRYYEGEPRKAVEAAARDLSKLRAMGLVAGDAAKEKILSEATELLLQELSQMKDAEDELKKKQKEEKAAMKALKKQQKEAKKAAMKCGDDSSESSESECEEDQSMKMSCVATSLMAGVEKGMVTSMSVPQIAAVPAMDFDKAAMKAMKKREKEQKKAAKKALKMKKEEEKRMATLNSCMDKDSSSCSSESSDSEREGGVLKMSRCATITAPPASSVFPIIVPQIPESVAPDAQIPFRAANSTLCTTSISTTLVKLPPNRIEVCMGGKCKKSGSLAVLQGFEDKLGTSGTVVRCKCLGKCGEGPNVRLQSDGSVGKDGVICTGVDLVDVGDIAASLVAWGGLSI